jgi:hypothetical protein
MLVAGEFLTDDEGCSTPSLMRLIRVTARLARSVIRNP